MKYFRLFHHFMVVSCLLVVVAFTCVSCQKEESESTVVLKVIAESSSNDGKAYVNNNYMCWHDGDEININGTAYPITVTGSGDAAATAVISNVAKTDGSYYCAAYPAGRVSNMSVSSVRCTIPSEQVYKLKDSPVGAKQLVEMPMVGRCSNRDEVICLSNAASLVQVDIINGETEELVLHSVGVALETGYISGTGTISLKDDEEHVLSLSSGSNSVRLDCCGVHPTIGEGETLSVFLVVAPFSEKDVTVSVVAKGNSKKHDVAKQKNSLTLGRNQIGKVTLNLSGGAALDFPGFGTEKCPYLIENATQLSNFRGKTSGWFKQTADIDYSSVNGGSYSNDNATPFTGHYDGGRHSIEFNLSTTGLFKTLGDGAVIENLTLKGGQVSNNVDQWGAFSCSIADGAKVTLKNCTNKISCKYTGSSNTASLGGLIGYANHSSIELTLENCSNKGVIFGKSYVGGVLGYAFVKIIRMTGCSNEGAVTGTWACVGGLVSFAALQTGNSDNKIDLDCCVNSGEVKMNGAVSNGACGGIIGYINGKKDNTATITNCANKAKVSAGNIQCMGGIVGKLATSGTCTCNIFNSYSTGNLSSSGTVNATNGGMGGIMAIYKSSTKYKIEINNCYFSGTLSATSMTNYSGIASKTDANITCENCYSVNNCTGGGSAADISITPITNKETLLGNLNTNAADSSGWSSWKKVGDTYPVFLWE